MAVEGEQVKWSWEAGADLSSSQYKFVELGTNDKVTATNGATDRPIGVLQNDPTSGQTAVVAVSGITKVQADADLDRGDPIKTSADGQAAKITFGSDTTHFHVGTVIDDPGSAGDIVTAIINCANPSRGA